MFNEKIVFTLKENGWLSLLKHPKRAYFFLTVKTIEKIMWLDLLFQESVIILWVEKMAASKSFLDSLKKPEPTSFKMTDFRRELHLRHKRDEHAKKERMKALQESKLISKYAITIDTSRARSNCDVLRMCVKELGFKEVIKYLHHK